MPSISARVAWLATFAGGALAPPPAHAGLPERFAFRLQAGAGSMISNAQRDAGFDLALQGGVRLGMTVFDPLVVQLGASGWRFPTARGEGQASLLGGGLRFEPRVSSSGRLFVDGTAGVAITGGQSRAMFDLGLGFEFDLTRWLGVGPELRYGRVIAGETDLSHDAQFWSLGLSVALRLPAPLARPRASEPIVLPPTAATRPLEASTDRPSALPDAGTVQPTESPDSTAAPR